MVLTHFTLGELVNPVTRVRMTEERLRDRFTGHSEPAPTRAHHFWMNGKWSGYSFLVNFSSLANYGD
jgi:hypothetical protein